MHHRRERHERDLRFHQIREGERWNDPNLDSYKLDKTIVIEIVPPVR